MPSPKLSDGAEQASIHSDSTAVVQGHLQHQNSIVQWYCGQSPSRCVSSCGRSCQLLFASGHRGMSAGLEGHFVPSTLFKKGIRNILGWAAMLGFTRHRHQLSDSTVSVVLFISACQRLLFVQSLFL